MKVTVYAENKEIGISERHEAIEWETVTIKEVKRRNGAVRTEVRIAREKRDIVVASGTYETITVQDEETGRYLLKYTR